MKNEFVIWGCNKGEKEESLLLANFDGKPITDQSTAKRLASLLSKRFSCHSLRIQKIVFDDNLDFSQTVK